MRINPLLVTTTLLLAATAADSEAAGSVKSDGGAAVNTAIPRPDIDLSSKRVDVTTTSFDSGIADIKWLRNDGGVVLVLTTSGSVWRSANGGRKFAEITNTLVEGTSPPPLFESINVHPDHNSTAILISRRSQHFITHDGGLIWRPLSVALRLHNFIWHPTRPDWALFSSWSPACNAAYRERNPSAGECNHMLYGTQDGGRTARRLLDYVVQYNWGSKEDPQQVDSIYYTAHRSTKNGQPRYGGWHDTVDFSVATNFGDQKKVLVKKGNKFLIAKRFMFVAQLSDHDAQTVNLMVSNDFGRTFHRAKLPATLHEKSYTILDTSEGSIVIHVNHGGMAPGVLEGNVYVSDESGLRYSLSLARNVRSPSGECEFDKVLGSEGVYMANYRDSIIPETNMTLVDGDDAEASKGDALSRRHSGRPRRTSSSIRTVISFDKGGSWNPLTPPVVDSLGQGIKCDDPGKCWLHLHGITHFDRFAPFYSAENAMGLIMGTGNIGSHLSKEEVNTYISRDGGLTWNEAHKGPFIYEFGDHGGLVVMAKDSGPTNQVVFSWNEGTHWYDFMLGMSDVQVDNIVIEPTGSNIEFLLYGMARDKGVVFHMDFASLNQPSCQMPEKPGDPNSDYEFWTPKSDKGSCILGRKTFHTRRRPLSACFNGKDFTRSKRKELCRCTKENYQCEVGFYRPVGAEDCEPSPYEDRAYMDVEGCTASGIYYTHAWRKVPGDECVEGWKPEKVPVPCPPGSPYASQARLTLGLVVAIGALIASLSWASKHPVLRKYVQRTGFDTFVEVGYTVVGRTAETVQRGGEELFNFWTSSSNGELQATRLAPTFDNTFMQPDPPATTTTATAGELEMRNPSTTTTTAHGISDLL